MLSTTTTLSRLSVAALVVAALAGPAAAARHPRPAAKQPPAVSRVTIGSGKSCTVYRATVTDSEGTWMLATGSCDPLFAGPAAPSADTLGTSGGALAANPTGACEYDYCR